MKSRISKVYAFFSYEKISLLFNDTFFCKCPVLIYVHARELFMFLFSSADFLQNEVLTNKPPRTTIGVSNSWIQIKTDILLVFIWVQTVCKRLLADARMQRVITGKHFSVQFIVSYR